MFGKTYIIKNNVSFTDLIPGSPDWMIYWAAYPEQQEAMLAWHRSREATIKAHGGKDSLTVVDFNDTVIAFSPKHRVHANWPFLKHRRSHVITLSPNRREVILLKEMWSRDWVSPSRHIYAEESYFLAAQRALEEKIGIEVMRGRLREICYEQKPDAGNDYEATVVYEYVVPNLTEVAAETEITSVDIRELLQTKNTVNIGGLFWRLFNKVVSNGELKWRQ